MSKPGLLALSGGLIGAVIGYSNTSVDANGFDGRPIAAVLGLGLGWMVAFMVFFVLFVASTASGRFWKWLEIGMAVGACGGRSEREPVGRSEREPLRGGLEFRGVDPLS